jgi:chloride channel protein, CIC family
LFTERYVTTPSRKMKKDFNNGIPISMSLKPTLEAENIQSPLVTNKKRLLKISALAVLIAMAISFIAKVLVYLIDLFTNISFFGNFSFDHSSPANHQVGVFVIIIPVIGGLIVGLMALYGSKAIRGHGIPEAMEQILINQSKIKPAITYLKPLSAAISIGTGGPFGAEGPIIATGGAFGSTIGQVLKISHNERKILLAAGATAGMSAIFGSPIAAIFLAIELLLFEFSPRSIIPVALACITGAAGHHLLFEQGPVFPMKGIIESPSNVALLTYSIIGIIIGLFSVAITKIVYFIEDSFEKLPIHWMFWPALGGLAVGTVGYFAPRTLGVGYENITEVLSGNLSIQIIFSLCLFKFISWAISLGSGTSGGTLAPLLTIGGASGALLGSLALYLFPQSEVVVPLSALVGMAAMFAGASRAVLTSIIFALETTSQSNALLPLLASCTGSYFVSFFLMENTIMTEKIARRGVNTPDSYEPDLLKKIKVAQVFTQPEIVLSEENSIREARTWLKNAHSYKEAFIVITNNIGEYRGVLSSRDLLSLDQIEEKNLGDIINISSATIYLDNDLRQAIEKMSKENCEVLPVITREESNVIGVVSYKDILKAYQYGREEHEKKNPNISLKNRTIKVLLRGQKIVTIIGKKKADKKG